MHDPLSNRPHIKRLLGTRVAQSVMLHLQNLCWTLERLSGHSGTDAGTVSEGADDGPWIAQDCHRLIEACRTRTGQGTTSATAIRVAVVIPSRLARGYDDGNELLLVRAVESVKAQVHVEGVEFSCLIGVDRDSTPPEADHPELRFVKSDGRSQVKALNAALGEVGDRFDYVSFLEDDDQWHPEFCLWALSALALADFVSSTQLEVDEKGRVVRIFDFPTPSGWMMPASTLRTVGLFDERAKWHPDNEWLGRLNQSGLRRCHMVECHAPTTRKASNIRPDIANVIGKGASNVAVLRHALQTPLVVRLMHSGSGMSAIRSGSDAARESEAEYQRMIERFGALPW